MDKYLCIHGHFYQPPREDPWLDAVLPEGSAAPSPDWNHRITRESYAPLAHARRLDGQGRIVEILNCYEWISFNAGPTLLTWMEKANPELVSLLVKADQASRERLGHGNALAQIYHHQIMPLASQMDKELEVSWAVDDFIARFGREPEGMWLSETAVDTPTLETLAAAGIRFTILAPSQARAVAPLEGSTGNDSSAGAWTPVDQNGLDIRQPYLVKLPSGRSINVFFYDGPLSQAVAFERLLADGETFWRRLSGQAGPGLSSLATDGETYGHHFTFGEMALAFVLDQAKNGRDGLHLTNFAAYLAANPPVMQVTLHEPSAWSCPHGVERWRSACGCTAGGHPGWQQAWRAPLRQALALMKQMADLHYFQRGGACLCDPRAALTAYGKLLAGTISRERYASENFRKNLSASEQTAAWKLVSMQRWALASHASCAWFFDDIARIEPVNALTYALRAMELARDTGSPDIEAAILPILTRAVSNDPEIGDGEALWNTLVKPRQESTASLAAQALLMLWAEDRLPQEGESATVSWPAVAVTVVSGKTGGSEGKNGANSGENRQEIGKTGSFSQAPDAPKEGTGRVSISWILEAETAEAAYSWTMPDPDNPLTATIFADAPDGRQTFDPNGLPVNKRQAIADAFAGRVSDALWRDAITRGASGASLVTELQEGQSTMTFAPRWAGMWPALAWRWLWGLAVTGKRRDLLVQFLRQSSCSGYEQTALMERVLVKAIQEANSASPDWDQLRTLVRRARELNLSEAQWWPLQNLLWDKNLHAGGGRSLAELLGFAV